MGPWRVLRGCGVREGLCAVKGPREPGGVVGSVRDCAVLGVYGWLCKGLRRFWVL